MVGALVTAALETVALVGAAAVPAVEEPQATVSAAVDSRAAAMRPLRRFTVNTFDVDPRVAGLWGRIAAGGTRPAGPAYLPNGGQEPPTRVFGRVAQK